MNWIDTVVGNIVTTVATNRVLGAEQPVFLREGLPDANTEGCRPSGGEDVP